MKTNSTPRMINYILSSILVALLIFGCKKPPICIPIVNDGNTLINLTWQDITCPGSFDTQPTGNEMTIQTGNQFLYPAFNPNNPYEFICYQIVADSGSQTQLKHQLIKFNLNTGTKTIILENVSIVGKPAWSKSGWIAYKNIENGLIYIFNEQLGMSLPFSNFPNGGNRDENLTWINDDTLLWGGLDINLKPYLKTRTIGEETINTLAYGSPAQNGEEFTVSTNDILLARNSDNTFSFVDLKEGINNWQSESFSLGGTKYGSVNWNANNQKFYVPVMGNLEVSGLYEVDFVTKNTSKIYDFCQKRFIKEAVCSPDGKYLLIQKIERSFIPDPNDSIIGLGGQIIENSSIWLYDVQTKKEAKIKLE